MKVWKKIDQRWGARVILDLYPELSRSGYWSVLRKVAIFGYLSSNCCDVITGMEDELSRNTHLILTINYAR